ncbi:Protein POLAR LOCALIZATION DURING ASYMMETRIC DIVISION AND REDISTRIBUTION [Rhynchospora pubera]|uniref:Protein POLAR LOCALIZATION DURING ASYMMETRIC DIVISION AND REDISTRIBUTION n=1 Tax=Rhynchospora pubera TaxID=906938 RepID=A0AAV8FH66_9POAL|nr:Protein POLAR LOCALIZATION DURING ASYMMETRIC DIVISION AND REDISTRIBUTION [Rhynchospora pubera]
MDAKHRRKKSNSISSVLTKPESSGASKGFGCRVRFPIYSCSFVKGKDDEDWDEGEVNGMEVVGCKEVKREEEMRVFELKFESEACMNRNGEQNTGYTSGEISNKMSISSEKKDEDASLNLGMGVGLMLLLSKSTTELNKMVELRKEMETLLVDLKNEIKNKNGQASTDNSSNAPISLSSSGGNENSGVCLIPLQEDGASNLVDDRFDKSATEIEAEFEVELKRLELSEESRALPPLLVGAIEPDDESYYLNDDNLYDSFEGFTDFREQPINEQNNYQEEEQGVDEGDYNSFDGGVCPRELERRLNEVLHSRQRERIEELEYALECAKSRLHESEREICWWRDTARLVTQHKDDSHFR